MKIFGSTVGTTLPKPSWSQANPKKGDYIKDKPTEMEPVRGYSAYQVAVMNGFEGTEKEWLESLKADTEVIVQEIIKEENMETIVQEVLKPENTTVIVDQVKEQVPGHLMVSYDWNTKKVSHSASEINAHLDKGGSAALAVCQFQDNDNVKFYVPVYMRTPTVIWFLQCEVYEESVSGAFYSVDDDKNYTEEVFDYKASGGTVSPEQIQEAVNSYLEENPVTTGKPFKEIVVTEHADGSVTMENTFTDDTSETIVLAAGEKPASITYNGVAIPIEWVVET